MSVTFEGGIEGKVCSRCHLWKPLSEFYPDPTKGESQGFTHCRCKSCHAEVAKLERLKFRLTRERAVELGDWDSIEARAKMAAQRRAGFVNEELRL